jgi:nicotinate dehydrogenase subunit A
MATLRVNGKELTVSADPATPLLYVLRNDAGLHGPRFGCGLGQCGSCTVHVNGEAVRSCMRPLSTVSASDEITTLEGLGTPEKPHKLQTAFIEEQAVQCGYCINGMIMQAAALLAKTPKPTVTEIKQALVALVVARAALRKAQLRVDSTSSTFTPRVNT